MKKYFSSLLVCFSLLFSCGSVSAQSTSDLEAQIQALLARIAALDGGGSTTTSPSSCNFTQTLSLGSTGAEVVELQSFLERKGLLVLLAGESKGYFGGLTQSALASYQAMVGISPAVGYFGAVSRAYVNGQCSTVQGNDNVEDSIIPTSYPGAIVYAMRHADEVTFRVSSKGFVGGGDVKSSSQVIVSGGVVASEDILDLIDDRELDLVITDPTQSITVLVEVLNKEGHVMLRGENSGNLIQDSSGDWEFPDLFEDVVLYLPETIAFKTDNDDIEKGAIVIKDGNGNAVSQVIVDFDDEYVFIPVWAIGTNADLIIFEYDSEDFYSSEVQVFGLDTGLEKEVFDIELEFEYVAISNLLYAYSDDEVARINVFYNNQVIEMKDEIDTIVVDNDQENWRLPAEKLVVENLENGDITTFGLNPNERNVIELSTEAKYRFWLETKELNGGKG